MKILIVGAGEVGYYIASRLAFEHKDVVVVDRSAEALRRVSEDLDVQVVVGSGSNPVILETAGVRDAEIMLAVTDSDEANLVACLMADTLSAGTKKLARLRGVHFDAYRALLQENAPHIDTIINPDVEVVRTIERLMELPGAVDVAEFADGRLKFVGVYLAPTSPLAGVRLDELPRIVTEGRPLIAAVVREEELIIPRGKDRLNAGDLIYFISEEKKLHATLATFDKQDAPAKRILIVGGGRSGLRLASALERRSLSCKIIERRPERCAELADQLDKTIVLCGDGSDQRLLLEENVGEMDLVVTMTRDEETNILTSLLAKRLGARKSITRISKFSYFPLMSTIGLEQVVSPRLSAINTILQHIRRGKILSAIAIKGDAGEVMEAVALETSAIVSKPLMKIQFPKGAILAGVIRGEEIIIPSGQTIVQPGDRTIIFARRDAVPGVEKLLSVKLAYF
ncbi:MAG: Trk system potassium transporter TrkA [Desulfosarcinaceae bacterium]|nr:Trk system potassium transporter TrkA [Desulfosarcinaceae bacterium]